jgi:hypothetical protein
MYLEIFPFGKTHQQIIYTLKILKKAVFGFLFKKKTHGVSKLMMSY